MKNLKYLSTSLVALLTILSLSVSAQTVPVETPAGAGNSVAVPIMPRTSTSAAAAKLTVPPPPSALGGGAIVPPPPPGVGVGVGPTAKPFAGNVANAAVAAPVIVLPTAKVNPELIGFPVLPSRTNVSPTLPTTGEAVRVAPQRMGGVPPPPSLVNGNASMSAGGSGANVAPPNAGGANASTIDVARPNVLRSNGGNAAFGDDLSSLLETPDSPQSRALPGVGRVPGTVNAAKPIIVRAMNGVNNLVPLSTKYPNRIVTPFRKPEVVDDGVETMIKGNSVYVKLDEANPRGVLFIHDADAPSGSVIQLTFIGRNIPPQTIIAQLDAVAAVREPTDESDYTSGLRSLMRTLLRGGVPQGYTEEELNLAMAVSGDQLAFRPERRFAGSVYEVLRYAIKNQSAIEIELSEEMFGDNSVKAVSFWPRVRLLPNEETKVFIVARIPEEDK